MQSPLQPRVPTMTIESDGWGARKGELQTGGRWSPAETPHHKLSRTASSLSSSTVLHQAQQWDYHSNEAGQCHSSDIHQQVGRNALRGVVSASTDDLGLVCTEGCLSGGRTPPREGQHYSRPGIAIHKGPLRLDAEPPGLPADTTADGPTADRPFCIPANEATTEFLQLETRPGGNCNGCVQPGLGSDEGICQSPMVLDSTLSESDKKTKGKVGDDHSLMGIVTMVSNNSGNARGLPQNITSKGGSSHTPSWSGIHNEPRCTRVSGMAHIRESF